LRFTQKSIYNHFQICLLTGRESRCIIYKVLLLDMDLMDLINMSGLKDIGDVLRLTLLFDFYGDLLTARRRECFELHVLGDMSLNETAAELGITPQGVADNVGHAVKALEKYERALGLVESHKARRAAADQALGYIEAGRLDPEGISALRFLITKISD